MNASRPLYLLWVPSQTQNFFKPLRRCAEEEVRFLEVSTSINSQSLLTVCFEKIINNPEAFPLSCLCFAVSFEIKFRYFRSCSKGHALLEPTMTIFAATVRR